ncbi:glutamic acid-rich protein, partial [Austrofundulus limnaeus]|uniref:Glutamic acid-rich protein n=1 Tax=Austrofundulus limnaeus TaxID=52670 RepID=A0A2I4AJA6_AUSLI
MLMSGRELTEMRRQQLKQRLDVEEEDRSEDWMRADQEHDMDAFSIHQLHVLVVPEADQELMEIKEDPEELKPDVDQQDQEHLHIKEEEEELWISLGEEQLNVKEETDDTIFSFTEVPVKHEDDEDKPEFLQLHQHQDEVRDVPTSSSADNLESTTGGESCGGAETTVNQNLSTHEDDSDSSETEVSEDDEEDNYVNNPDFQLKHFDSGSKPEYIDMNWESPPSMVPETVGKNNKIGQKPFSCEVCDQRFNR